ncbi:MAG: polyribonucleotide nucleotidyltransferase [Patescibacteria group bacterium]
MRHRSAERIKSPEEAQKKLLYMEQERKFSTEWGGRTLTIGVGALAGQANGSCTVQYGDTYVLSTATLGGIRPGLDFFPLQVDFEERMYAAGRIKGSRFIKREGRPTDEAILSGRLIDRAVRPLFDDRILNEVAVVATVFSHDQENDADIPGLIGAACALEISDIPWKGPLAAVRIGRIDGQWVLNPTYKQTNEGQIEIIVAGTDTKVVMLEAGANQITEQEAAEAIAFAQEALKPVLALIQDVKKAVGKEKVNLFDPKTDEEKEESQNLEVFKTFVAATLKPLIQKYFYSTPLKSKTERKKAKAELKEALDEILIKEQMSKEKRALAETLIDEFLELEISRRILEEGKRVDGRGDQEIRELSSFIGILPRTHGSGLFNRGETQVLSSVTLGSPGMEQTLDTMEFQMTKRYFHHYNFPGYSVGETKANRGPGRREIGHGALAERALLPVLPTKEVFPYTIRAVSEVLSSNGSSSMGSTCGSTLALMDAGVPIEAPVAGIAMGLASDEDSNRYRVITDLQDLEDGVGGMDFKVAGTRKGITAIQMDTKTSGIPFEVIVQTLNQALTARVKILDVIEAAIPAPRSELSKWAPRIETIKINPDRIRDVIGPGGKIINEIIAVCNVQIDIDDDGTVMITSTDPVGMKKATDWVKQLTREITAGEVFTGPVTRILDFGAFVEISPKQEGLVHISEIAPRRIDKVTDVLKVGDIVTVKVIEIDSMGRVNLSIKRAAPDYQESSEDKPFSRGSGERRGPPPHRSGMGGNRRDDFKPRQP